MNEKFDECMATPGDHVITSLSCLYESISVQLKPHFNIAAVGTIDERQNRLKLSFV